MSLPVVIATAVTTSAVIVIITSDIVCTGTVVMGKIVVIPLNGIVIVCLFWYHQDGHKDKADSFSFVESADAKEYAPPAYRPTG